MLVHVGAISGLCCDDVITVLLRCPLDQGPYKQCCTLRSPVTAVILLVLLCCYPFFTDVAFCNVCNHVSTISLILYSAVLYMHTVDDVFLQLNSLCHFLPYCVCMCSFADLR